MKNIKRESVDERRRHRRFLAQYDVVAIPRSSTAIIGQVIDISLGGLAVHYESDNGWLKESSELDLFELVSKYFLAKLPIKIISDFESPNSSSTSFIKEKRCGLKFEYLSYSQASALEDFINNFTIREE